MDEHEARFDATCNARDAAWAAFGATDPYFVAPAGGSSFAAGPPWPGLREAYRVIRGPLGTIVASDGLSDPFTDDWTDPPDQNGFAVEVYAVAGPVADDERVAGWMVPVVAGFARAVAERRTIHDLLDEFGTLSTELPDVPIPDEARARFVSAAGRVAVLVGLRTPEFPDGFIGPVSPVRLVNLKLLTVAEFAMIAADGDAGRDELARRLLAGPDPLVSSLTRASVVAPPVERKRR